MPAIDYIVLTSSLCLTCVGCPLLDFLPKLPLDVFASD